MLQVRAIRNSSGVVNLCDGPGGTNNVEGTSNNGLGRQHLMTRCKDQTVKINYFIPGIPLF